jgi:hypothetical protein
MTSEQLFSVCNTLVLPGWILLFITPRWQWTERIITGVIVILLALVYTFLVAQNLRFSDLKSFGSLDGVILLFTSKNMVLAGWIHYLAFDLMVGLFVVKNAQKLNIPQPFVMLCLVFTFMLGPVGLLLYFIIRAIKTRNYFAANY